MHCSLRKVGLQVLVLLAGLGGAYPQEATQVRIPHVRRAPRLEDFIRGTPREAELKIEGFLQRKPLDGAPVSQSTTAFLSYDDQHFYAAFICKADPRTIRAHLGKREDVTGDDLVSLSLDTYHDRQRAYEFFSNPLGVQLDGITAEGMDDDDFSFDTVWQSQGRIIKDGYVVLISIPFKSLRFRNTGDRTWGIALGRIIPSNRELSTWPQLTERIEAYVPQFATVEAPQEVSAGHNAEFVPYVFASNDRFLDTNVAAPALRTEHVYRGGLDAKIVFHDALTVDATINPDFSQVESDEPQVTVNQRYEVFFPEKRPFFLENSDFFDTPETLLFTRRILDPQFGGRLSGKINDWKIGLLAVDDRAPGTVEPLNSPLHNGRAHIFAVRAQKLFGGSSSLGGMITNRRFGSASTTVWSVDTRLKLSNNWIAAGQFIRSDAVTSGSDLTGDALFAELRRVGRKLTTITSYRDRSAGFAGNDLGFFRRTNIRQIDQELDYRWRPETGAVTSAGPLLFSEATWDHAGILQDWTVDMPMALNFKGPASFTFGRTESFERYQEIGFRKNLTYVSFAWDKFRTVSLNGSFNIGTDINFFPAAGALPSLGKAVQGSVGLQAKPLSRLQAEEKYIFSRLATPDNRIVILETHLLRSRVNYQFTRPLSLRAIVDYDAVRSNSLLVDVTGAKRLNFDLLLTYFVHPGTALYAGYSNQRENVVPDADLPTGVRRTPGLNHLTARQFFVKLSYDFHF